MPRNVNKLGRTNFNKDPFHFQREFRNPKALLRPKVGVSVNISRNINCFVDSTSKFFGENNRNLSYGKRCIFRQRTHAK